MTAAELYEHDAGFRGFLAVWDENRRCPLELVDYLLDRDMTGPAECARWCATYRDRSPYDPAGDPPHGTYPQPNTPEDWYFHVSNYTDHDGWANSIPARLVTVPPLSFRNRKDATPALAIVALMDAWVVPVTVETT